MKYTIEAFDPNHFEDLVPLLRDCMDLDVDRSYFEWKYLENPAGTIVGHMARLESGRIIGFFGTIPERYRIYGEAVTIFQSVDAMIHQEFRKQGIFMKLLKRTHELLDEQGRMFVIGFAGPTSTPAFIKLGCTNDFNMHSFFKHRSLIRRFHRSKPPKGMAVKPISPQAAAEIFLQHPGFNENAIYKVMSEEYLSWKLNPPHWKYHLAGVQQTDGQQGVVVYSQAGDNLNVLALFGTSASVRKALVWHLEEALLKHNTRSLFTFAKPGTTFYRDLKATGFLRNPLGIGPLSRPFPMMTLMDMEKRQRVKSLGDWELLPMEYDGF